MRKRQNNTLKFLNVFKTNKLCFAYKRVLIFKRDLFDLFELCRVRVHIRLFKHNKGLLASVDKDDFGKLIEADLLYLYIVLTFPP